MRSACHGLDFFGAQCFGVKFTALSNRSSARHSAARLPAGTNRETLPQGAFEPAPGFLVELAGRAKRRFAQLRDSGFEGGLYVGTNGVGFGASPSPSPA